MIKQIANVEACNFCGKLRFDVKKLISGPDDVHICDECVGLCNEILDEEPGKEEEKEHA